MVFRFAVDLLASSNKDPVSHSGLAGSYIGEMEFYLYKMEFRHNEFVNF